MFVWVEQLSLAAQAPMKLLLSILVTVGAAVARPLELLLAMAIATAVMRLLQVMLVTLELLLGSILCIAQAKAPVCMCPLLILVNLVLPTLPSAQWTKLKLKVISLFVPALVVAISMAPELLVDFLGTGVLLLFVSVNRKSLFLV